MTNAPTARLVTADELLRMPQKRGVRYELVEGKLICMSPSGAASGFVSVNALIVIGAFVKEHDLGQCGGEALGFKLASDPDVVRAADVAFIRKERLPAGGVTRRFWVGAPDLVVEVISPTDRFGEVLTKVQAWLDGGALLVWVLDPDVRTATRFRAGEPAISVGEDGVLDGEDVLPGFQLRLAEVWVDVATDE
jgi:Uma2 family endonuclease